MISVEEGTRVLPVELVRLISQGAARRDEAERTVFACFPCEVRGASHDILEQLARGDQRVDQVVLDGGVAPQHQYLCPLVLGSQAEEDQIEDLGSFRARDSDPLVRRLPRPGDGGNRFAELGRRPALQRGGEVRGPIVGGADPAAGIGDQRRPGKPGHNRARPARQPTRKPRLLARRRRFGRHGHDSLGHHVALIHITRPGCGFPALYRPLYRRLPDAGNTLRGLAEQITLAELHIGLEQEPRLFLRLDHLGDGLDADFAA